MTEEDDIFIRPATNRDGEKIRNLVFGVLEEYGLKPDASGTDKDIADIEANYLNRGGLFEVLEDVRGNLLGTVGLYPIDRETIELRKMYFARDFRGKGYGKKTLARMIEKAERLGFEKIYLETASVLKEAVGLYERFGFAPTCEKHSARCDRAYILRLADGK
ncbi:MAG TPA: GNAT family N-acetyltransferase [Pyrinomonadaceae bacterium]|nr:GNAT family N-acetyltransferase [Pyrinomonadaceae bacterium]